MLRALPTVLLLYPSLDPDAHVSLKFTKADKIYQYDVLVRRLYKYRIILITMFNFGELEVRKMNFRATIGKAEFQTVTRDLHI